MNLTVTDSSEVISVTNVLMLWTITVKQEVLGRTSSSTFPTYHLFEVLESNLMERNLSENTLSFSSIQFNSI
jgi:hypothetical protein